MLPAGLRQKDQTTKGATGPLNRDKLLQYLEKEAMDYKDRDDVLTFTGERKGTRMICLIFDIAVDINRNTITNRSCHSDWIEWEDTKKSRY